MNAESDKVPAEHRRSSKKLPREWRPRALGAAIFTGLIVAGLLALPKILDDTDVEATFSSPSPGAVVGHEVLAEGQLSSSVEQPVWLLTVDPNGRYRPQNESCRVLSETRFECGLVYIGTKEGPEKPEKWRFLLVLANREGNAFPTDLGKKQRENPNYEGLPTLPAGLQDIGDVGVAREARSE